MGNADRGRAPRWAIGLGLAAVHWLVVALVFEPAPHTGGDNAGYIALARSLLEHGRYLELWDPARPVHVQYPPGFPAFLAAAMAVGVRPWLGLKVLAVAVSGLAVAASYLWSRARAGPAVGLGVGLALAVAPGIARESQWVLSDVPFWALTAGALLAAERQRRGPAALLAFLALAFRTAGLPLVVAMIVAAALRRRWREAAGISAALVVAVGAWTLRAAGAAVPYVSELRLVDPYDPSRGALGVLDLLARGVASADRYAFEHFMTAMTGAEGLAAEAVAAVVLAAALVGWVRRLVRGDPRVEGAGTGRPGVPATAEIFVILYLGMLAVWPLEWSGVRFLLPVLPLVLTYAAEGAAVAGPRVVGTGLRGAGLAALLALAVAPLRDDHERAIRCRVLAAESGPTACLPAGLKAYVELAGRAGATLPEGAVSLVRKPRIWFHYARRPARLYPFSRDPARLLAAADSAGAGYLVLDRIDRITGRYAAAAVIGVPERFCEVDRASAGPRDAVLVRILDRPWPGPGSASMGDDGLPAFPACDAGV
jgi:hypothetical protein